MAVYFLPSPVAIRCFSKEIGSTILRSFLEVVNDLEVRRMKSGPGEWSVGSSLLEIKPQRPHETRASRVLRVGVPGFALLCFPSGGTCLEEECVEALSSGVSELYGANTV